MLDPGSYRQRMRRRDNWNFLLIFGSIVLTVVFLVILAKDLHWF
jgi:hypothetical protein